MDKKKYNLKNKTAVAIVIPIYVINYSDSYLPTYKHVRYISLFFCCTYLYLKEIIYFSIPEIECFPQADALNPCEDIMGVPWLRISVWCVIVLAILGNLAVIVVFVFSHTDFNVSRFLICNLAFADFCMGFYLLLIASMDIHSVGEYFNFAYNWQFGKIFVKK